MKITNTTTLFPAGYSREKQPTYRLVVDVTEAEYITLVNLSARFEGGAIDIQQLIYEYLKVQDAPPVPVCPEGENK